MVLEYFSVSALLIPYKLLMHNTIQIQRLKLKRQGTAGSLITKEQSFPGDHSASINLKLNAKRECSKC